MEERGEARTTQHAAQTKQRQENNTETTPQIQSETTPIQNNINTPKPQSPTNSKTGLKELFKSIDADGSGAITVAEMRGALSNWGHRIGEAEMAALMAVADVDGDGLIDYNEVWWW